VTGVRAASFPVRLDEWHRRDARAGAAARSSLRLDTFLAGAADATLRLTEVSGVVHDVPLYGLRDRGYTRDSDAEPGSRCKSDTVLATVTRELEPDVATGPTGWEGGGESARPGSQEIALASSCSADPTRDGGPVPDRSCLRSSPGMPQPPAVAAGVALLLSTCGTVCFSCDDPSFTT